MMNLQKAIKYGAIAFAIMLIVFIFGTIYQIGSGISYFFTDNDYIMEDFDHQEYDNNSSILNVEIGASNIEIKEGKELAIDTNNKYVSSKQVGNKLIVKEKRHSYVGINKNDSKVIIYVPRNTIFDEINLKVGAGTLEADSLLTDNLDLEFGAGTISINNIVVNNEADIEGGAGEVNIKNAHINNLDLSTGVGEFNITGKLTGKTDIDAGVGEVNVNISDKEDNYSLEIDKGIGSISVNGKDKSNGKYGNGANKIDIDGGVGSVNVKFKES